MLTLPISFPGVFFISWVGLIPFLYILEGSTPFEGFKKGTVLGIVIFLLTTGWIYYPLVYYSGLPWFFCIFLLLILFVLLGLIYGLWAWLLLIIGGKKIKPFILALSWVTVEFLRYKFIPALPFSYLGYTQVSFLSILQIAEVGSFLLISFLVVLINGYFYKIVKEKRLRFLLPVIILFIIIFVYGAQQITYFQNKDYKPIKVGVVMTNLDPEEKWAVKNIENNMDYLIEESSKLKDLELVIWPESSLTFDLIRNEFYRNKFMDKLKKLNIYVQTGSLAIIDDDNKIYNSSFLIAPDNSIINRYNKIKLVPFGEYIPFQKLVKMLTGIEMVSEYPGGEVIIFSNENFSWKTAICSEILYPELVGKNIDEADFIVNQSNEAWYRRGNLQQQMWAAAIFRAVENRKTVVKSGNKSYSGFITPWGESRIKSRSYSQPGVFEVPIDINQRKTLYQKYSNLFGLIITSLTLVLLIIRLILINLKKTGVRYK